MLEIGIGSGLNLPFYSPNARLVIGLDPSPKLLTMARRASQSGSLPVEFIEGSPEKIPLEDASADTVLTTWTLCSIPTVLDALCEMRRVVKADRTTVICRARPSARPKCAPVAGSADPGLEAPGRRLPS